MPDIKLTVLLSQNRDESGLLYVSEMRSGKVLAVYEALGRGSRGGGDTQFLKNGNTPTGLYAVEKIEPTANWNQSSYGPSGALVLRAVSGVAVSSGRRGILVHGGSLVSQGSKAAKFRMIGGLKPTHGCIRLRNEDIEELKNVLFEAALDRDAMQSQDITVSLEVTETPACISSAPKQCGF